MQRTFASCSNVSFFFSCNFNRNLRLRNKPFELSYGCFLKSWRFNGAVSISYDTLYEILHIFANNRTLAFWAWKLTYWFSWGLKVLFTQKNMFSMQTKMAPERVNAGTSARLTIRGLASIAIPESLLMFVSVTQKGNYLLLGSKVRIFKWKWPLL